MELNENLHNFFEGGFCDAYWPATKDPSKAVPQAQQALDLLGAKDGHILDWRGGWGSHALHFAQKGFRVSLLDFSQRYMDMAKAKFSQAGLRFTPILVDCRQTPPHIQADFAVCMGNSVGFLESREEIKAFASLRGALKPGARVLVDCMNLFFLSCNLLKEKEDRDVEGNVRKASHRFDFATNTSHSVFELVHPDGSVLREEFHQTLYSPHDLSLLLSESGFVVDELYGEYNKAPLVFDSRKIVAIAHKPE
jgi:SAM-dependent methyltransferase